MVKPGNDADDRPGRNPEGRGALGASLCREPSRYRHIASGSPPRPASHIASVAHVPTIEIGSGRRWPPPTALEWTAGARSMPWLQKDRGAPRKSPAAQRRVHTGAALRLLVRRGTSYRSYWSIESWRNPSM